MGQTKKELCLGPSQSDQVIPKHLWGPNDGPYLCNSAANNNSTSYSVFLNRSYCHVQKAALLRKILSTKVWIPLVHNWSITPHNPFPEEAPQDSRSTETMPALPFSRSSTEPPRLPSSALSSASPVTPSKVPPPASLRQTPPRSL